MLLQLPHTAGCLVCGRDNPHGLHLDLRVDSDAGIVHTNFTPERHHIGFTGIAHGGVLATVLDEAMVWAATWPGKRFCYCGEMTVRYRKPAMVGEPLTVEASVVSRRSRLISTIGTILDPSGQIVAEATGKYVPMSLEQHELVIATLLDDPSAAVASEYLRSS
ncbi:MAG: PaaI family thioesterase [Phycisphaerae bacterium]|nr:PaaI family thioesterase [Phycisphaerae bacterium]